MLNNPWLVGGSPMTQINNQMDGLGGSGHMVVQTQSVSISSSDGSVIHQTNTYESWVTMTGPQQMSLDLMSNAAPGQNIFGSVDVGNATALNSRPTDAYLAVSMAPDSIPGSVPSVAVSMHNPFVAHTQVEPVVALPTHMAVTETPFVGTVQNPAETFIALPVPSACDPLVAVPTIQNMYSPLVGTSESSVPVLQSSVPQASQTNTPSWYLVVQDTLDSTQGMNGISTGPSVVRTDDDLFLCMRCNSTFEKVSCIDWHLRECRGNGLKNSVAVNHNLQPAAPAEVKTIQCSNCGSLFTSFSETASPFVCSNCSTNLVPVTFSFGIQQLRQFKCSECSECFEFESELDDHQNSHKSSVTICELPDNYTEENGNEEDDLSVIVEPMVEPPDESDESGSVESESSDDDRDHSQKNSEKCGECGDNFSCRESLDEHLKSHGEVRSYGCTKCGIICVGQYSLSRHVWAHNRETEEKEDTVDSCFEEQEDDTKDGLVMQPFGCTECGMQFSDSNELKEHCVSHLRSKPFSCTQCGEKFETTNSLERHWEAHAFEMA